MMWELIAANRRRSLMLFIGMAVVLCALGYMIGAVALPEGGGKLGLVIAVGLWMALSMMSVFGGGSLVLRLSGAREVSQDVHPQLFNVVEEMKIAAGLEQMPKIYIIDDRAPNAFATGLSPQDSAVAVTAGLLARLNRDELQGVIAHEVSHIMNRDMQFMTLASIMLGTIVIMSDVFLRGMWMTGGGSSRRYRSGKGGGGVPPQLAILAIVLAILGPVFARLLYFAISRKREYLADACAARLTRYPAGLAGALEKISQSTLPLGAANRATAPMFIANPFKKKKASAFSSWSATHPPIGERIAILRCMHHGAGLDTYQSAFQEVKGKPSSLIPTSGLKEHGGVDVRPPHQESVEPSTDPKKQVRDVLDLMRAANGFVFLICACGLKLKVPPELEEPHLTCPRCKRDNQVPRAQVDSAAETFAMVGATVGAIAGGGEEEIPIAQKMAGVDLGEESPLTYRRRTDSWESFACMCGNLLQISPAFTSSQMKCRKCSRITRIS
jgi:heat shock protein HtpX